MEKVTYMLTIFHPVTEKLVTAIDLSDQQAAAIRAILPLGDDTLASFEYEVPNVFFGGVTGD